MLCAAAFPDTRHGFQALDFTNVAHSYGNPGVRGQILLLALRPKERSGIRQRELKEEFYVLNSALK